MPKYVIERDMPGAGQLSADELRAASQKSNEVLAAMLPRPQWLQSYVTDDKLFCIYIADNPDEIREHASTAGFPCNAVREISTIIDPSTADPA
jgi:hypothetical protein